MDKIAQVSLIIYAVLMSLGGIMGFVKGKSKASLIAGVVSAILLGVAYFVSTTDMRAGMFTGLGVTSLLTIVFGMRLKKTKKFMPSGMLLVFTMIEEVLLILAVAGI